MPPKPEPIPRARTAMQWLSGFMLLGVLAGGVVAAAVALWQNVDVQRLARAAATAVDERLPFPAETTGPMAAMPSEITAALYISDASAVFFPDSQFYPKMVRRWEHLVAELGTRVRRVSSPAEVDALPGGSLLVAPEAVCLSRDEIEAFHRHLDRAGGLVVNWAVGARDENCSWRGWNDLMAFTGALDLREEPTRGALYFTLPMGIPLSAGLSPGTRVELHPEPHLALLTTGPRAYWSDWALNPLVAHPAADASAVLAASRAGGRVAWFGFREGMGALPVDEWRLRQILLNGTRWAAGIHMAEVAPWPEGRQAALFIAEDVESGFGNAAAFARLMAEKSAPATFFTVSKLASDYPGLADSLTAAGEIASQTSDHSPTVGLPLGELTLRLRRSSKELREWTGNVPRGLRPPEERFDDNTLQAWRKVGGEYVAAVNHGRSAAPEIHHTDAGPVVLLPRLVNDDYNVFVQQGARHTDRLREAYLQGMRKLGPLGGLAYLNVHSQIAGTPERVHVLGEVIDSARVQGDAWWMATGAQIADWWLARDQTRLTLASTGDQALEVQVKAVTRLDGVWVDLYHDGLRDLVPFEGERQLAYARTEWGIRVAVPELAPGLPRTITLRPEAVGPGAGQTAGVPAD